MKNILSKERWALCFVLAFTFASFFLVPSRVQSLRLRFQNQVPEQWAKVANNGPYRSFLVYKDLGFTDEGYYAGRFRQIVLHGRPYGPWLANRNLRSWIFDSLGFYPVAAFVWLCDGNIYSGWTLAHAVIGCFWIGLLYALFRAYGKDELSALMVATFIMFFMNTLYEAAFVFFRFFESPATSLVLLRNLPSTLFLPLTIYMRFPTPGVSYLWAAVGLTAALMLSRDPKRRPLAAVAAGTMCGLLCFVHLFEWIGGIIALCLLAAKIRLDPEASEAGRFNLTVSAVVASVISGAYYVFARSMTADLMHDIIDINSAWGGQFRTISIAFFLCALLFWRLGERRQGVQRQILIAVAAVEMAAAIASNLSLVIGYDMQFSEHAAYYAIIAAIVGLACWTLDLDVFKKHLKPHALVLTVFFCAWFAFKAKVWADTHFKFYGIPADVAAAFDWMNSNVPKDSTLLALSAPISFLTPLEAEMRMPVSFASTSSAEGVSMEKNLRAFAGLLKTLDADPERFRSERWILGDLAERTRVAMTEDLAGTLDWEDRERVLWPFFFLLDTMPAPNPRREKAWHQVLGYLQEAQPLSQPFYAWIQKSDEALLRRTPVESGGRLIYRNPSVSLYSFPNGSTASAAPKRGRR